MKFGMLLLKKEVNVCLCDGDIDLFVCPFDVIPGVKNARNVSWSAFSARQHSLWHG